MIRHFAKVKDFSQAPQICIRINFHVLEMKHVKQKTNIK
jgi:hypothetical protein